MDKTEVHRPFLAAARGETPSRRPVWVMRQAGRYLPEYRQVRERMSFLELCRDPEAAAEVTLQPIRRYDMDAAILFTDLLIPVEAMGLDLRYEPGPVIDKTVTTIADVDALRVPDPEREIAPMLETVKIVRRELPRETALIGFVGAPFTMACYMVEGRGSKAWDRTRRMMYGDPDTFEALQRRIVDALTPLVSALVEAGCDAIQVFDSWALVLGTDEYAERCASHTQKLLAAAQAAGAVAIDYVSGVGQHVATLARSRAEIVGVDWRLPMREVRRVLPADKTVQGNLDPALLFADETTLRREVRALCDAIPAERHVFNLGHGIFPDVDPEAVRILVDEVRR